MTQHLHPEVVVGCYRCELGRDEAASEPADYWFDQRYEDALFAELGEAEYVRRMQGAR